MKKLILLFLIGFNASLAFSQTKGLIIKQATGAGKAILDPDGNGLISKSRFGFQQNDEAESEIPFIRLVSPWQEPVNDLSKGPSCGFTDFVESSSRFNSSYYFLQNWVDPNNPSNRDTLLLFRFRLGSYAPNSKGYSILIDTDGRFGTIGSNADPNAVPGNPGFEVEILLATNFGVQLYNVDGVGNPGTSPLVQLPFSQYCQQSIALSQNCNSNDYFYDFYIPFSVIQSFIPQFTPRTPIRMVASTVTNPHSALRNNGSGISDVSGINDALYGGNFERLFNDYLAKVPSVSLNSNSSGTPPTRADAPTVNGPVFSTSTSINGTTAATGDTTIIRIYRNGSFISSGWTVGSSWTVSGISGLRFNDGLTATATPKGFSESLHSNELKVLTGCSAEGLFSINCNGNKGFGGSSTNIPMGTYVFIYKDHYLGNPMATVITQAMSNNFTWLYKCDGNQQDQNCNSGACPQNLTGQYWVKANDGCAPNPLSVCAGNAVSSTFNLPANITIYTTSIQSSNIPANTSLMMYLNRTFYAASLTGTLQIQTGTFKTGDTLEFRFVEPNKCASSIVTRIISNQTEAPVFNNNLVAGAFLVSGYSNEPAGTKIYIQRNGATIDSSTVNGQGFWAKILSTAVVASQVYTATAITAGKTLSPTSNSATVLTRPSAPTVTGSYNESSVSVTGTVPSGTANGSIVYVYVDGMLMDSVVTSGTAWTLSGLREGDLYAGGRITATLRLTNSGESSHSSQNIIISCVAPNGNLSLSIVDQQGTCINTSANIQINNTQQRVIYTLYNSSGSIIRGTSVLGDGTSKIAGTVFLTEDETFRIYAQKLPTSNCDLFLTDNASIVVKLPPDTSGLKANDYLWLGSSMEDNWNNHQNWVRWNGSKFETAIAPPCSTSNVFIKKQNDCIFNQPETRVGTALCHDLRIDEDGVLGFDNNPGSVLTVTGNWENSGTFIPSSGTVRFAGNGSQRITKSSGPETFNNVIIEGSSTRVFLENNIISNETGTLIINSGVIDLNGKTWSINNSSPSAISSINSGRIISESQTGQAILRRNTLLTPGSTYIFPMGTEAYYLPVSITLNSGNAGIVGVSTYNADPMLDTAALPGGNETVTNIEFPHYFVKRFWHLYSSQPNGSFNVNTTFSFASTEAPKEGIPDTTSIGMIAHRYNKPTDTWDAPLPSQSYNHSSRRITTNNITGFSWWAAAISPAAAMPVSMIDFNGECDNSHINLNWTTASELNNEGFSILVSVDGKSYELVDFIKGAGNSLSIKNYSSRIRNTSGPVSYIKIAQKDYDGKIAEYGPIAVKCGGMANDETIIYPNPAKNEFFIQTSLKDYSVRIMNAYGQTISVQEGINQQKIEVSDLVSGLYTIEIRNQFSTVHKKLLIAR
jgi:hypothetical protein